ncbi:hypothetical protein VTJ04DRAFT_9834 [Mycothermus thermophilus]|uniref:uncharacterized protein n=1 Tax=Humicola insolens TaxID=85995 RepID=UPI00374494F1
MKTCMLAVAAGLAGSVWCSPSASPAPLSLDIRDTEPTTILHAAYTTTATPLVQTPPTLSQATLVDRGIDELKPKKKPLLVKPGFKKVPIPKLKVPKPLVPKPAPKLPKKPLPKLAPKPKKPLIPNPGPKKLLIPKPILPKPMPKKPLVPKPPLPKPKLPVPNPKKPVPKPKLPVPKPKLPVPKPKLPLPKPKKSVPKPKPPVPKPKLIVPKPKKPVPEPKPLPSKPKVPVKPLKVDRRQDADDSSAAATTTSQLNAQATTNKLNIAEATAAPYRAQASISARDVEPIPAPTAKLQDKVVINSDGDPSVEQKESALASAK